MTLRRGSVAALALSGLLFLSSAGGSPDPAFDDIPSGAGIVRAADTADSGQIRDHGIGGTGVSGSEGIGGTGRSGEGGIGGTGGMAGGIGGTGIVGTVTAFGSIWVNGLEIAYDDATPVRQDGEPASVAALAVGQVVEVLASGEEGALAALDIAIRHDLVGPVTATDLPAARLLVMGQSVEIAATTRLDAAFAGFRQLTPGVVVRVSGLWRPDGVLVASRVDSAPAASPARVRGVVREISPGSYAIGVVPLDLAAVQGPVIAGAEMRVAGRWSGGRLVADRIERVGRPFAGRAARLVVEGYPEFFDGGVRVGGVAMTASEALRRRLAGAGERVVMTLTVRRDGMFSIERAAPAPGLSPRGPGEGRPIPVLPGNPDRPDPLDRIERPERPERPLRIERPLQIERPPKVERPPVPARPELPRIK